MRRIFIGDIQGCSQALDRLIDALALGAGDRLISVGDLVNRGPDSLGVLRRLADRHAEVLLGNHDLHLLQIARRQAALPVESTLQAVLEAADGALLLQWLGSQRILLVEPDLVCVHAGLHPLWHDVDTLATEINEVTMHPSRKFSDQRIAFATRVRYCDARGRRPLHDDPPPGPPFRPWDDFYHGQRTVVFGHWARRGLVQRPRLRGLDTGCVYGGPLTAWIAEEDRFVQVEGQRSA